MQAIYALLHRVSWLQGAIASAASVGIPEWDQGHHERVKAVGDEAWFLRPAIVALGVLASRHSAEFIQILRDDPRAKDVLAELDAVPCTCVYPEYCNRPGCPGLIRGNVNG